MSANRLCKLMVFCGAMSLSGLTLADDMPAPDLEFLEYLGSWEESDEEWVLFAEDAELGIEHDDSESDDDIVATEPSLTEVEAESDDETQ